MNTLGLDIGGTAVKAALVGPGLEDRLSISGPYVRPDRTRLTQAVAEAVRGLGPFDADAAGLCVPGRRSPDGTRIELAVNVPGLEGWAFEDLVRTAAGRAIPSRVFGDAEAATFDAAPPDARSRRVLGLAIGTGIGASLRVGGSPSPIGHLGQIDVGPMDPSAPAGVIGPDGGRDSAEAYLGVGALRDRLGEGFAEKLGGLPPDDPALKTLVRLIRVCLAAYTPDLIIVLGGVGIGLSVHADAIESAVRADLTRVAPRGWELAFGSCRHHAARGAARLAALTR